MAVRDDVDGFTSTLALYIAALESYLSELDKTFDKLFEDAKKMAEKQIKEMPKKTLPKFYEG
jgi:hypothetical protein